MLRNIGYKKWIDKHAALESSDAFNIAVETENKLMAKELKGKDIEEWQKIFTHHLTKSMPLSRKYAQESITDWYIAIDIQQGYNRRLNIWIGGKLCFRSVVSFTYDKASPIFAVIEDATAGMEQYILKVCTFEHEDGEPVIKPIWYKNSVGPDVIFSNDLIYYQGVENYLRYPTILVANKSNGLEEQIIFEESDPRFQTSLHYSDNTVFIKTANALYQKLAAVNADNSLRWLSNGSNSTLIPFKTNSFFTNEMLISHIKQEFRQEYGGVKLSSSFTESSAIHLPIGEFIYDAYAIPELAIFTTINSGCMSLYLMEDGNKFIPLYISNKPCDIRIFRTFDMPRISISSYNTSAIIYEIEKETEKWTLKKLLRFPETLSIEYATHNTEGVPYTVVSAVSQPKKLLVEAYGAYGVCANRSYPIKWLAWLEKGYAVAIVMPRGGRDNGDDWYAGGKLLNKQNTFTDTINTIKIIQTAYKIKPENTVIYGRSAGGWTAAYVGQMGGVVGAVYAEVPYVDVLNTTTNPTLPLTKLEYDEFGNPIERPEDFEVIRKLSPVDNVPLCDSIKLCPFILAKTALNDIQVLPYESLKWAKELRNKGWNVLVNVDMNGGHFTAADKMHSQYAADAAIIDSRIKPKQNKKKGSNKTRKNVKSIAKTRKKRNTKTD